MDKQSDNQKKNDFSRGSVVGSIIKLAVPMTLAQFINALYNIMDCIYIGMVPENTILSLTGLGLCLLIISTVIAFANLFDMGGAPLCFIERGRGNKKEAEAIMGNSFVMMVAVGILLTVLGLMFKRLMLYLFGASNTTIPYADVYVAICLMGNAFVMIGLDMNSFINPQGFGIVGMMTVLLGAVTSIVLDPAFIFVFHTGVGGAALATILSQMLSVLRILALLTGRRTTLKLWPPATKLDAGRLPRIMGLGMPGSTMSITNSFIQIMYNSMFQKFGGGLYVGIMTVISSIREVISMSVNGPTSSAQPAPGCNCGAREYKRVQKAIVLMSVVCVLYIAAARGPVDWFPAFFTRIFNREGDTVEAGVPAIRMYFFGFLMVSLQSAGQSMSVGPGKSRNAVFFPIFRKVIIVIPLTIVLPIVLEMGTQGIPMAEPIPNSIGGIARFGTVLFTVWPELKRGGEKNHS